MFRTITTKRQGVCKRCSNEVPAGTKVRYNGFGIWHFSNDPACQTAQDVNQTQDGVIDAEYVDNPYPADERAVGGYPTPATEDRTRPMQAMVVYTNTARNVGAHQQQKREVVANLDPNHPAANF